MTNNVETYVSQNTRPCRGQTNQNANKNKLPHITLRVVLTSSQTCVSCGIKKEHCTGLHVQSPRLQRDPLNTGKQMWTHRKILVWLYRRKWYAYKNTLQTYNGGKHGYYVYDTPTLGKTNKSVTRWKTRLYIWYAHAWCPSAVICRRNQSQTSFPPPLPKHNGPPATNHTPHGQPGISYDPSKATNTFWCL